MKELVEGEFYTVRTGRFKGRTGRAFSHFGGSCHALWFPELYEEISFWGFFHDLRKATATEELRIRRWMEENQS
jgi:hypothetical protein